MEPIDDHEEWEWKCPECAAINSENVNPVCLKIDTSLEITDDVPCMVVMCSVCDWYGLIQGRYFFSSSVDHVDSIFPGHTNINDPILKKDAMKNEPTEREIKHAAGLLEQATAAGDRCEMLIAEYGYTDARAEAAQFAFLKLLVQVRNALERLERKAGL